MTNGADGSLDETLRALRREYLADSTQRVEELRTLLARVADGEAAALADLRRAFHKLAGSGGSYGFSEVTAQSRRAEQQAERLLAAGVIPAPTELAALEALINQVDAAFAAARRELAD